MRRIGIHLLRRAGARNYNARTNILIYALTDGDSDKKQKARVLAGKRDAVISTQVLLETSNVLVRKAGARAGEVSQVLRRFTVREVVSQTPAIVEDAWRIADRYGYSIFDSAILASALAARCPVLYSENLPHDQAVESLRIQNPFLSP